MQSVFRLVYEKLHTRIVNKLMAQLLSRNEEMINFNNTKYKT